MGKVWDKIRFKSLGGSFKALEIVKEKYEGTNCTKEEVQVYYYAVKQYLKYLKDNNIQDHDVSYYDVDEYIKKLSEENYAQEKC